MKIISVFLFVLIIIGLGFIATYRLWVPILVGEILRYQTPPIHSPSISGNIPTSSPNTVKNSFATIDAASLLSPTIHPTITGIFHDSGTLVAVIGSQPLPLTLPYTYTPIPGEIWGIVDGGVNIQSDGKYSEHIDQTINPGSYVVGIYHSDPDDSNLRLLVTGTLVVKIPPIQTKTYTSTQYGFSIDYPNTLETYTDSINGRLYFGAGSVLIIDPTPLADDALSGTQILVNVSTDSNDVTNCVDPGKNPAATTVTFGGVDFLKVEEEEPATAQELFSHIYTTRKGDTCYMISGSVSGGNPGRLTASQISEQQKAVDKSFAELDPIIQTFRFTQ